MSKLYETAAHRREERKVAKAVEKAWGVTMRKLDSRTSAIDYRMQKNGVGIAWAEVRCREKEYASLIIDKRKLISLAQASFNWKQPSFLFVRWPDGIHWWKVEDVKNLPTRTGGRYDRSDPLDIDTVCHIGCYHFKPLAEIGIQSRPASDGTMVTPSQAQ